MLLAFILFMAMQGRLWTFLATLSAGIGFGLFLDELGKFITSDNDYFFQPAIAIMYVLFVVLFFVFRALGRVDRMGPETALVNSFDFAKEAVMRCHERPASATRRCTCSAAPTSRTPWCRRSPPCCGGRVQDSDLRATTRRCRPGDGLSRWYQRLVAKRWFRRFVLGWFIVTSVLAILSIVALDATPVAGHRSWT